MRAIREQFYAEQRGMVVQQVPFCLRLPISHAVDGYPDVYPEDDDGDDGDIDGGDSTANHAARSSNGTFKAGASSPKPVSSPLKHALPISDTPPAPPLIPLDISHRQDDQPQRTQQPTGLDPGTSGDESDYDDEGDEWGDEDGDYEDDDVLSIDELDDFGKDEKYRYAFAQTAPSDPTEGCKHYRRRCQKKVRSHVVGMFFF